MKILFLTSRADIGGGPKHITDVIEHLPPEYECYVACPSNKPYYELWSGHPRVKGIFELPFRKFSFARFISLALYVKKNNFDIAHSHGRGAGVYSRLLKITSPNIRVFHTVHGFHMADYSLIKRIIIGSIERIFSSITEATIAVSEGEKKNLLRYKVAGQSDIKVIYNGVPELIIPQSKTELRNILDLPADKFILCTVARFQYLKNLELTLDIAELLLHENRIALYIIGDGEDYPKISSLIVKRKLTNIHLLGFKSNGTQYIKAADLYLSSSLREGLPLSLIEANMLKIPSIASDVTGNNETVIDGYNGYMFKLGSPQQAVSRIMELFSNGSLRAEFGKNARAAYENNFMISPMMNKLISLYKRENAK